MTGRPRFTAGSVGEQIDNDHYRRLKAEHDAELRAELDAEIEASYEREIEAAYHAEVERNHELDYQDAVAAGMASPPKPAPRTLKEARAAANAIAHELRRRAERHTAAPESALSPERPPEPAPGAASFEELGRRAYCELAARTLRERFASVGLDHRATETIIRAYEPAGCLDSLYRITDAGQYKVTHLTHADDATRNYLLAEFHSRTDAAETASIYAADPYSHALTGTSYREPCVAYGCPGLELVAMPWGPAQLAGCGHPTRTAGCPYSSSRRAGTVDDRSRAKRHGDALLAPANSFPFVTGLDGAP